jgi:hypothetical protein
MQGRDENNNGKVAAIWLNIILGIYNFGLYGYEEHWFNLVVGSLNIGVGVFFRQYLSIPNLSQIKASYRRALKHWGK